VPKMSDLGTGILTSQLKLRPLDLATCARHHLRSKFKLWFVG
jgi:hypothetical protein